MDKEELVYFFWMYFGGVVIAPYLLIKSAPYLVL